MRDRVAHSRLKPLGALIAPRAIDPLLRFLCRRLATMVLVLRKRAEGTRLLLKRSRPAPEAGT